METFKHIYCNICKEMHIDPDTKILSLVCLEVAKTSLDLSTCRLNKETCTVVGYSLAKDVCLTHLDFTDSFLPEEGLINILRGLENNRILTSLILKGNNIKCSGTQALGKFLRNNRGLLKLNIDWNSLGILPEKFFTFCEGLGANTTLKELSLKNNHLNNQCASSLSNALVKNAVLEALFIQNNNMGLVGGRALLSCLFKNKTLTQMEISDNNMTTEIENSIYIAILHNRERNITKFKHAEEARTLTNKLHEIESNKQEKLSILLKALEKSEKHAVDQEKKFTSQILSLEQELAERNTAYEVLSSKYQTLSSSLSLCESNVVELVSETKQLQTENNNLKQSLMNFKREQSEAEQQMMMELNDQYEKARNREMQLEDCQRKITNQDLVIQKFNSIIKKMEVEIRMNENTFDEKIQALKGRHSELLHEHQNTWQKDVERLKSEQSEMENCYQQRVQNLLNQRLELEKTIGDLKNTLATAQLNKEEQLEKLKIKMKSDEDVLRHQLQEEINLTTNSKLKTEKLLEEQLQVAQTLQIKTTALNYDLEEQNHKMKQLQQQLEMADHEQELAVSKIKLEVKGQLEEAEREKQDKQKLLSEIELIKKNIEDVKIQHVQELKAKNDVIKELKLEKAQCEQKIQDILNEEKHRATQLQLAFVSYLDSTNEHSLASSS